MIIEKEVRMVINQFNINYYQEKLKEELQIGQRIMIPVDILPSTSGVYVTVQCEYCGRQYKQHYRRILTSIKSGGICCKDCRRIKVLDNCIKKYGVRSTLRVPEVQAKVENNILQKYGSKQTYHQKQRELFVQALQSKYGVTNACDIPGVREKANLTLFNNGTSTVYASKQQIHIGKLVQGIINYPVGPYHLDVFIPNENIGIEYSGGGHDLAVRVYGESVAKFNGKEKARRSYFKNHDIPIIELVSKTDKLPNDKKLLEIIQNAKKQLSHGCLYINIDLDNL